MGDERGERCRRDALGRLLEHERHIDRVLALYVDGQMPGARILANSGRLCGLGHLNW
jgi:hypothetical protein